VEISHFLRARPWASVLALLIPLLAAGGAYYVLKDQPPRYTATATVSVPGNDANSASRVGLFVADFAELATSGPVLNEVSASTGESRTELEENVVVARIGQSSLFTVAYTGEGRTVVEPVVRGVITSTFNNLVQVSDSDAELKAAQGAYDAAVAARTAYQDQIGTLQPDRDYNDLSARIRGLQITPVFGSAARIAELSAQRDALVPEIRQMEVLDQPVQAAASQRDQAAQDAASVQRAAAEAQSASTIQDLVVVADSTLAPILQGVGVAAVAGLLVGLTLLLVTHRVHRRRSPAAFVPRRRIPTAPVPATEVAPARAEDTTASSDVARSDEDEYVSPDPAVDADAGGATASRQKVVTGARNSD